MRSKEIILLCGKSGGGKNYLVDTLNLKEVVSHTERPKRSQEVDGIHKHFHKPGVFTSLMEYTEFVDIVASTKRGEYYYWCTAEDLMKGQVYVIDFPGILSLLDWKSCCSVGSRLADVKRDINFKIVYVKTGLFKRIRNMRRRGEPWKSIISRVRIDRRDFRGIEKYAHEIIEK